MINYYEELEINPSLSCEEIDAQLKKMTRLWRSRLNAPALEDQQRAQNMVQMISDSKPILTDPAQRAQYDDELRQNRNSTKKSESKATSNTEPEDLDEATVLMQVEEFFRNDQYQAIPPLALKTLQNGIENAKILAYAGAAYYFLNDYQQAMQWLDKAYVIDNNCEDAVYWEAAIAYEIKNVSLLGNCVEWFQQHESCGRNVTEFIMHYYFMSDKEPMAYSVIQQYMFENKNDQVFKRDAQKAYFDAITELFGSHDEPQSAEQCALMLDYAKKADAILSNGRSQEKLELLEEAYKRLVSPKPEKKSWFAKLFE